MIPMGRSTNEVDPALDDIEFLTRSANRVAVLDTLSGEPFTRDEIHDELDITRVTIDRALSDLGDRDWLDRSKDEYQLSPKGTAVTSEIVRLRARITEFDNDATITGTASFESPRDKIAFLARSPTRLTVLNEICERPRSRHELANLSSVSGSSLSRILTELEENNWIHGTNHRYTVTRRGEEISETFNRALSNIETLETLSDVLGWLPMDTFDFDVACLDDANIIPADYWDDPTKSIDHAAELIRSADQAKLVGPGVRREVAEGLRTMTVERDGTCYGIMEPRGVETVRRDEALQETFREILSTGEATFAVHQGDRAEFVLGIIDDTVGLAGGDSRAVAHDAVETNNRRVLAWAESYFEAQKTNSQPLDIDDFTP